MEGGWEGLADPGTFDEAIPMTRTTPFYDEVGFGKT